MTTPNRAEELAKELRHKFAPDGEPFDADSIVEFILSRESLLTSDLREAKELLESLEEAGSLEEDLSCCPSCGWNSFIKPNHRTDCKLSAFLSKSAQQSGEGTL